MDAYEALISGVPQSQEEIKALVETLRRRRALGEVGALTGDRVMAPLGNSMRQQADQYADQLHTSRQMDADNAQTRAYQTGQLGHMGKTLEETIRDNSMRDSTTRRGQDLDFLAALLRDRAGGSGSGTKAPPRLTISDKNFLRDGAEALNTMDGMLQFMDGGGKLGAVEDIPVGGSILRKALNAGARVGVGTKESKQTAMMWQTYKRFYSLRERNSLFGATLTPNEMRAWDEANPSDMQTDEQIYKGLKTMRDIAESKLLETTKGLGLEGYSSEAIAEYAGLNRELQEAGGAPAPQTPAPQTPTPARRRIRVDAQGNVIGN